MLIWMVGLVSPVMTYSQVEQPSAWRTTPTLSQDVYPAYQFRSTSHYTPIVGQTRYISSASYNPTTPTTPKRARRGMDDEDPEGPEMGLVDTPIGNIPFLWMAIMACVYALYASKRKKSL
ncbi:MAG: hypothetical protein II457_02420 [Paludibacteraceae bacterium]|nr:hypothetical protein [Paludibacteraceae bacterium]